ncbi:MAG: hypothetical protein FWG63_11460 [Defluviitaleaceae bacterium]|nr:hypothetical protein [Defluviitaleaceae bacterium]
MYRGINKVDIEENAENKYPSKKQKASPIRLELLVSTETDRQIVELAQATSVEKTAVVRMLMWFAIRLATKEELVAFAAQKGYLENTQGKNKNNKKLTSPTSTRITAEMDAHIKELIELMDMKKKIQSNAIRTLLEWALENLGNYTLADLLG